MMNALILTFVLNAYFTICSSTDKVPDFMFEIS
jgi:hypothetical protein